jgi:AraC-like DNA-binding protein
MTLSFDPHRHPEPPPGGTTVVFDDHRFCAGRALDVCVMAAPHMHSQFELNFVLSGAMTYRFDGRTIRVGAGELALFWGMIPHQTVGSEPGARFVCLYLPSAMVLGVPIGEALRNDLFRGAFVSASEVLASDPDQCLRWREDLIGGDPHLEAIVRDEVGARLRRLERGGWRDLCGPKGPASPSASPDRERLSKVEVMARFIDENAEADIGVAEVAAAAGLHPNYAMGLFKSAVGQTIVQYVTRRRLDTAQALLISTEEDVTDIAFRCGFGSLSRFYEAFTAKFGMSPRQLRRRLRAPSAA